MKKKGLDILCIHNIEIRAFHVCPHETFQNDMNLLVSSKKGHCFFFTLFLINHLMKAVLVEIDRLIHIEQTVIRCSCYLVFLSKFCHKIYIRD